jgi:GTPase SAR1 family protein
MITPEKFKIVCGKLLGIVNQQSAISAQANLGDKTALHSLVDSSQQLSNDTLRVLVMGMFSSGKSTFLNALMGKKLLPAKPQPTTAVIGEILYSETPEVTLYPKDGYAGGNAPFTIKLEELSNYITIDNTPASEDQIKENPFEKVVIKYPLPICKHGIMFVDSPGLNDPTCHDSITKDYLPTADAILYCMNINQAYTADDKHEIEHLLALGYKSIIFAFTYYDVLLNNDENYGSNSAEETRKYNLNIVSKFTDLGENGVFFVGSLPALTAKLNQKPEMLERSNFPIFEKRLDEILFNEKGRLKLLKALYSTRRVNRITSSHLTDLIEMANANREGLAKRIHDAESKLQQAQSKANEILRQFQYGSISIIDGAKDRGRQFFLCEILPNINTWASEFTPSEKQSISMWHPKKTGTAFAEGCIKHVQSRIEAKMAEWCEHHLVQEYIMPQLENLTDQQNANLGSYEEDLKKVRTTLNLSDVQGDGIIEGSNAGSMNRILSAIAGAFFISPAGILVGGAYGMKGLLTSLVTTIVGLVVLGIINLFNPVGWTALIIMWVVSTLVSSTYTGFTVESNIKKKIAEKMKEELSKKQEFVANHIGNTVSDVLHKVQDSISDGLNAPVNQYKEILAEAQLSVNAEESDIQERVTKYSKLRDENTQLANDLDSFAQSLNA